MLLKTSTNEKHYHLAFIRQDGTGYTSLDKGHFHRIDSTERFLTFEVDQKQLESEFYNADPESIGDDKNIAESQALKQYKLCSVVSVNGHIHKLEGITLKAKVEDDKLSDHEKVKRVYEIAKEVIENDAESKKKGYESAEFYRGEQWGTAKSSLEASKRAAHVLNYTKRIINFLSGLFRQNVVDIQVLPEEESDIFATDILNPILRKVQHNTNFHREETQAFDDLAKVGRCALMVDIDTNSNPFGDVCVNYFKWSDFSVSEHTKIDGSDADIVILHPMYSLDEIKAMYPDKADDIQLNWNLLDRLYRNGAMEHIQYDGYEAYRFNGNVLQYFKKPFADMKLANHIRKQIAVFYLYEKKHTNKKVAANAIEDEYVEITRLHKRDMDKVKNLEGFALINSRKTKVKVTTVSGSTLLDERYSLFDDFNICFAYANKDAGHWWGIVEDVKDPQREINKWSSKFSDLLNKSDAWRLAVSPEAFASNQDYREYLEKGSEPGYVPKFAPGFQQHIQEYNNSNYSQLRDVLTGIQNAIQQISDITNIQPGALGATTAVESGAALQQKQRVSLLGNEYLFDNFAIMKQRLGKLLLQAIQKTWSPERILRLTEAQNTKEAITIGGKALYPELGPEELLNFAINTGQLAQQDAQLIAKSLQGQQVTPEIQGILQNLQDSYKEFLRNKYLFILENKDIAKYDVTIVENTHSPTTMMNNFMMLVELAKTRPDIPISAIIKNYPFLSQEDKNDIINTVAAAQQAQADEQRMKSETELKKVMLANQGKQQGTAEQAATSEQPPAYNL